MKKKAVIAGGTGFIGQYLEMKFTEMGYEVKIISRQSPHISWGDEERIVEALENAEILINLAGKSVDCRYNAKNKEAIFNSRTETTEILGNALLKCDNPPPLWVNSSTATIYRHAEDRPMTEADGEIRNGILCRSSERMGEIPFLLSIAKDKASCVKNCYRFRRKRRGYGTV